MLKPFESILGIFDPDSFNIVDGEVNTGTTYNGKHIYKRTFNITELSSYVQENNVEDYIRFEGTLKRSGVTYPLEFVSVSTSGIVLENQALQVGDTGYFSIYYTKITANNNIMSPFVSTMAVVGILAVAGLLLSKIDPHIMQLAFDYIK